MLPLIRYANWHIRRYRRSRSTLELAIIFAFHCLIAFVTLFLGVMSTPVNPVLVLYGILLLALTCYIHRPNHHLTEAFRIYNLVIRNYRSQTHVAVLAVTFALQCLVSCLAISIGVTSSAGFLSIVATILGIFGLANTLYVHRPIRYY
jgi:uncharacterized protein involved in cysteine biosynthesis